MARGRPSWRTCYEEFRKDRNVFENAEARDLRVLTYSNLPVEYKNPEALTKRDIMDGTPLTSSSVIHRCKWEDLAVVTVDPEGFPGVDFTEPDKEWPGPGWYHWRARNPHLPSRYEGQR